MQGTLHGMRKISTRERKLLRKCVNHLDYDDIIMLYKHHDFDNTEEEIQYAIETIKQELQEEEFQKREEYINKNLLSYRVASLYNSAKNRAKKKDIPFTITKKWIRERIEEGRCPLTGIEFVLTEYSQDPKKECNPYAPSLDQIKPSAGYTKENTRVVINNYNKFKADNSDKVVLRIAKAIVDTAAKRNAVDC